MIVRRVSTLLLLLCAVVFVTPLVADEAPRRDLLTAEFKEINEQGLPIFVLGNATGKDIETIRGGFRVETAAGDVVAATGLTIAVPGQLFLAAGKNIETAPYGFDTKEQLMQTLRSDPGSLRFFFEVQAITYLE